MSAPRRSALASSVTGKNRGTRKPKSREAAELDKKAASLSEEELAEIGRHIVSTARGYIYSNAINGDHFYRDFLYIDSVLSKISMSPVSKKGFIMSTDGESLYYDPEEVFRFKTAVDMAGGRGDLTVAGILAHEALHVILGHTKNTGRGRSLVEKQVRNPGEQVLAMVRNTAMDKEVNTHVLRLIPEMHRGEAKAFGWKGIPLPDDVMCRDGIRSFEDFYVDGIRSMLDAVCKKTGNPVPEWTAIPDGEILLADECNALKEKNEKEMKKESGRDKGDAERREGRDENAPSPDGYEKTMQELREMMKELPQNHGGNEDLAHHMDERNVARTAEEAFAAAEREIAGNGDENIFSSKVTISHRLSLLGHPAMEGLIKGNWNDMAKCLMSSVAGQEAFDDWSARDPLAEIFESMGFGEMIAPGIKPVFTGSVVCVLDISGSIRDNDFLGAWMEIVSFLSGLPPMTKVTFIQTDTAVRDVREAVVGDASFRNLQEIIERGEYVRKDVNGGTDFHELFRYVREQMDTPDCIVFFTDMKIPWEEYSKTEAPDCPLLWVTDRNYLDDKVIKHLPFGQVFELGDTGRRLAAKHLERLAKEERRREDEREDKPVLITGNPSSIIDFDLAL